MAIIDKIDVEVSTIAVLIEPGSESRVVGPKEFEKVLARPVSISQGPAGMLIGSQRDQIEAIVGGNKVDVRDSSGKIAFAESKVPRVLDFIIGEPPPKIISYGVNFITGVQCDEPKRWVVDNII